MPDKATSHRGPKLKMTLAGLRWWGVAPKSSKDHDLVLKPMVTWGSLTSRHPHVKFPWFPDFPDVETVWRLGGWQPFNKVKVFFRRSPTFARRTEWRNSATPMVVPNCSSQDSQCQYCSLLVMSILFRSPHSQRWFCWLSSCVVSMYFQGMGLYGFLSHTWKKPIQ